MSKILKMLFMRILHKSQEIQEIKTIKDLHFVCWDSALITEIFVAVIKEDANFSTDDILEIANEAYQEVQVND